MNTALNFFDVNLSNTLDSNAESAMREFTMSNIERSFTEDNKQFWLNVAIQFEAKTRRLSKISEKSICHQNEKKLLILGRAIEIAHERSTTGFGLYQVKDKSMMSLKRYYESLLKLSNNVCDDKVKMHVISSSISILCKMVYPHLAMKNVDTRTLLRNAIADINCSDTMVHEEKHSWLICTQRLSKKLQKSSYFLSNPPILRLI